MNIAVTGTLALDYIMDFPERFADRIMPEKIHQISLSFLVDRLEKQFGGTAGNIAYSLQLLGITPTLVAPAGNDFAPYLAYLKAKKINTKAIAIHKDVASSSYFVVTDCDHNQIGSFFIGASKYAAQLSPTLVKPKPALVVISPTVPEAMKKYVNDCLLAKIPYVYDPSFQVGAFSADELRQGIEGAAMVIGNDYEISLILQKLEITQEDLRVMTPVLITTLGAKGSIIQTRNESMHIKPAKTKKILDPTGAGDAYRAGLVAGYTRGFDLDVCGQMGSVAGVYAVEKYGTQNHEYTKKEFTARYKENFGQAIKL